uniref:Kinesin-like protein n=1 Tax=Palpitomonas bilix TaxID=652834 RepID=A0A7S3D191_9EUKA|mmetsp:Transcript_1723/g.3625  ORF Transcript_1723/g.3625 Transcript_1723/m.3625 type:complete len:584 (+) Transcript_1723:81-1832(+)
MVKSAIRVCVRTRPTASYANDCIRIDPSSRSIQIFQKKKENSGVVNNQQENYSYRFDTILHNSSQDTVFAECGRDYVKSVLEGYNGTLLTYGQTGAGKTFTMTGGTSNYQYRGMIPRMIAELYKEIQQRPEQSISVRVSYLEIYNETMMDLLSQVPLAEQSDTLLNIVEDAKGNVVVKGLSCIPARTEEEALNLLFEGEMARSIGEHQLNKASSRSHCVFTLHIEVASRIKSNDNVTVSKLNLVDLAGSERVAKTHSEGSILKEAMYINKSLSFLEQVVVALGDRHRDHIPFRQSKLTHLLKDSVGGNSNTTLIANIWPEGRHLEETISTLKFANRMKKIKNDAVVNLKEDPEIHIKKMEREIRELKQELAMHDALANRSGVTYGSFSEEQKEDVKRRVASFVYDGEDIDFESVRFAREAFNVLRDMVKRAEERSVVAASNSDPVKDPSAAQSLPQALERNEEGAVGEVEDGADGFGVGEAPTDSRPPPSVALNTPRQRNTAASKPAGGSVEVDDTELNSKTHNPDLEMDKAKLFEEYKANEGQPLNEKFKANMCELKDLTSRVKSLAKEVNVFRVEAERYVQ